MRIALLSTSDTDLLSARASGADWVLANPARPGHQSMAELLAGCDLVVGRVVDLDVRQGRPLIFFASQFAQLAQEESA